MSFRLAAVIAVVVCATVVRASAHHSFTGEFDATKPIKLQGVVTKMEWINPHAWIHMDVKQPDGTVEAWMIECGTPNTLMRRGFTKDSLKAGTEITVDGYLARDGTKKTSGRDVTFSDGRKLFMGAPPGQPGGPPDLDRPAN
jgi:hypothetical protein